MIDYEDLILARQEEIEVWEDDPDAWEVYYGTNNSAAGSRDKKTYQESE